MITDNTFIDNRLTNQTISIALIGCGGTGSYLVHEIIDIARAVKMLNPESEVQCTLYDPSPVRESNLVRQKFFPTQLGMNKAQALAWTANNLYGMKFTASANEYPLNLYTGYDIIITALDRAKTRLDLFNTYMDRKSKVYWLDCGNDDRSGNVVLGEVGEFKKDEIRLPTVCDFFDYSQISDDDADKKSCSALESLTRQKLGVNAMCARIGGQLLTNLILDGKLNTHGATFDIGEMIATPIEVNGLEWEIFGYQPTKNAA